MLIYWTIITPYHFARTFLILFPFVLMIPGTLLFSRWVSILGINNLRIGDMKVPTFYSTGTNHWHRRNYDGIFGEGLVFVMFVIGVVYGGIHCVGWFYTFPSSDEAMLWRVSSGVLLGFNFLLPLVQSILVLLKFPKTISLFYAWALSIIVVAYVVLRLLLLVEAFISLGHLAGLLADKSSSFIPHF